MVNEEEATGLRACDDAYGYSAAGVDLDGELIFGEGILLPLGLVGAFAMTDGNETPVVREDV
jgi:hypothetical protein